MAVNATYGNFFLLYDNLWRLILMQILATFDDLWQYLATFAISFSNLLLLMTAYGYLWQLLGTAVIHRQ